MCNSVSGISKMEMRWCFSVANELYIENYFTFKKFCCCSGNASEVLVTLKRGKLYDSGLMRPPNASSRAHGHT